LQNNNNNNNNKDVSSIPQNIIALKLIETVTSPTRSEYKFGVAIEKKKNLWIFKKGKIKAQNNKLVTNKKNLHDPCPHMLLENLLGFQPQ